jgi:hypothetical protein
MMLPRIVLLSSNVGLILAVAIIYHFLEGENEKMANLSVKFRGGILLYPSSQEMISLFRNNLNSK